MTIAIVGAGFLGCRLAKTIDGAKLLHVDITDRSALVSALRDNRDSHITSVVNAAGKTGTPNVDWCEAHPIETYRSNVTGALTLADVCAELGIYLLHLGSGCIYYGPSPHPDGWAEDDYANPSAMYSRTKYAADLVLSRMPNVAIARLRMPIDRQPSARNLITKLAGYKRVIDVANSVTVVDDLVVVVRALLQRRLPGVFHVTNPGVMRHRELLAMYREIVDANHTTEFIGEDELVAAGLAVKARSNCILSSRRLEQAGIRMRPVHEALRDAMTHYAAYRSAQSGL